MVAFGIRNIIKCAYLFILLFIYLFIYVYLLSYLFLCLSNVLLIIGIAVYLISIHDSGNHDLFYYFNLFISCTFNLLAKPHCKYVHMLITHCSCLQ